MRRLSDLISDYYQQGKCLIGFNFNDIWDGQAICAVAERQRTPVMLMAYTAVVHAIGLDMVVGMTQGLRKRYDVPIYLHLDHCGDVGLVKQAVEAGFDSVMYDGSALDLDVNIANTKEVVGRAHANDVLVEAEIGKIRGRGFTEGNDFLAAVEDVKALHDQTGVDMIAVGIGTSHGYYEGKPEISFERLGEIHAAVDAPLVLHGGTGIPAEDVRKCVSMGMAKMNVGTAIHTTYMQALGREIAADGMTAYPPTTMQRVLPQIEREVRKYMDILR